MSLKFVGLSTCNCYQILTNSYEVSDGRCSWAPEIQVLVPRNRSPQQEDIELTWIQQQVQRLHSDKHCQEDMEQAWMQQWVHSDEHCQEDGKYQMLLLQMVKCRKAFLII